MKIEFREDQTSCQYQQQQNQNDITIQYSTVYSTDTVLMQNTKKFYSQQLKTVQNFNNNNLAQIAGFLSTYKLIPVGWEGVCRSHPGEIAGFFRCCK